MKKYEKLMSFIPLGRDNAISMRTLASLLKICDRDVRRVVLDARLDGELICGDDSGYYAPFDDMEALGWYIFAKARGDTTLKSIEAVGKMLRDHGVMKGSEK